MTSRGLFEEARSAVGALRRLRRLAPVERGLRLGGQGGRARRPDSRLDPVHRLR